MKERRKIMRIGVMKRTMRENEKGKGRRIQ